MSPLHNVLNPDRAYETNGFVAAYARSHYHQPEWVGDTTSNEYMPLLHAFKGMSEIIRYEGQRALIYKMQLYLYNPIYGRRVRGVNRNPVLIMSQFVQGGRGYLLMGDIGVEVHAGTIIQRSNFTTEGRFREIPKFLIMVGVKPEYVFSGNLNNPNLDTSQFILYVNSCMVSEPAYAPMYKKLYPLLVQPFIENGIRTVFVKDILPEMFKVKTYVPEFKSVGAMVDYKNAINDCIDMEDMATIDDYRDADAIREHPMPVSATPTPEVVSMESDEIFPGFDNLLDNDESSEPVSLPGVDGQPFQITLNAEDFVPTREHDPNDPMGFREERAPLEIVGLNDEQPIIPF